MSGISMTTRSSDGFLEFEFDDKLLMVIENQLGSLKGQSRKVLKTAVNQTAKQARERLANKAKETYVVQKSRITKTIEMENATSAKPQATIKFSDGKMALSDFKVSPRATGAGKNRPSVLKAKVKLKKARMGALKNPTTGNKAFFVTFVNGHTTVAERYGKARFPIRKLLSTSVPQMVSNEEVYDVIEPKIYDDLMRNIHQQMERVMNK